MVNKPSVFELLRFDCIVDCACVSTFDALDRLWFVIRPFLGNWVATFTLWSPILVTFINNGNKTVKRFNSG